MPSSLFCSTTPSSLTWSSKLRLWSRDRNPVIVTKAAYVSAAILAGISLVVCIQLVSSRLVEIEGFSISG